MKEILDIFSVWFIYHLVNKIWVMTVSTYEMIKGIIYTNLAIFAIPVIIATWKRHYILLNVWTFLQETFKRNQGKSENMSHPGIIILSNDLT